MNNPKRDAYASKRDSVTASRAYAEGVVTPSVTRKRDVGRDRPAMNGRIRHALGPPSEHDLHLGTGSQPQQGGPRQAVDVIRALSARHQFAAQSTPGRDGPRTDRVPSGEPGRRVIRAAIADCSVGSLRGLCGT
jgi:hypothetical protein